MFVEVFHKLVLGYAHWGMAKVPIEKMLATVSVAARKGVTEFDCAPHYGGGNQENVLGVANMAMRQELNANIKLSTKVGRVIHPDVQSNSDHGFTNSSGFAQTFSYTKPGIFESFKQSQFRLSTSSVHALYLHDLDKQTHGNQYEAHLQAFLEDGRFAFDELKAQKKIEIAGIGSNDVEGCVRLIEDGRFNIDRLMIAGSYNLLNFSALKTLFPLCKERLIQLYIAAPYGGGILSGQFGNQLFRYGLADTQIQERLRRIKAVCDEHQVGLHHAAMQFVHMHPQIDGVVVGARTPEEFNVSLEHALKPIDAAFWHALKAQQLIPEETIIHASTSLSPQLTS